jgi:small subunit ribosomal protein S2
MAEEAAPTTVVSMKDLLEAGVHFGHRTRRWNPKMKPYIFTERNGIHIIDLQQTITHLNRAYEIVKETVASGGIILFVGTKKQAQDSLIAESQRCAMPYVDKRWLGGTLTNWRTIRQRIDVLLDMERRQARGEYARLQKKEALMREREITRLNHRLGGLKDMRRLPNLLFVVDIRRDALAIKEANILGIPIIAMVDTNCDPDPIDYVIPSNDDAIRALKLMNATIANAVMDGNAIRTTIQAEEDEVATMEDDVAMERYLGPSTLAKIQEAAVAETTDDKPAEVQDAPEMALGEASSAEVVADAVVEAMSASVEEDLSEEQPEVAKDVPSEQTATESVVADESDDADVPAANEEEVKTESEG